MERHQAIGDSSEADSMLIRRLALLLRHGTDRISLDIDRGGWASLDDVVSCLNDRSLSTGFWLPVTRHQLEHRLCQTPFVERFECLKAQVRARYGHSLPHVVIGIESDPPMRLFHVSCVWHLDAIAKVGLLRGTRNFVHLTSCPEYVRSLCETIPFPIKLVVESVLAATRGIGFRQATAHVWLAPCIPAEFIHCRNKPLRELVQKGGAT